MLQRFSVAVVYASQTGTAKTVAWDIASSFAARHVECLITSVDKFWDCVERYPNEWRNERCPKTLIFVVSTTGQGEPPATMRRFWTCLLSRRLSKSYLHSWRFAIFGLGDRRYPQFNIVARKFRARLIQLGAMEFYRLGLGDDQHNYGYEAELDPWLIGLLETIALLLPNANNPELNTLEHYPLLPPQFCVSEAKTTTVAHDSGPSDRVSSPVQINERVNAMQQRQLYWAEVVGNERLTAANHFQTVHQLRLSLPLDVAFSPGDCLSVYPCIPETLVLHFIIHVLQRNPQAVVRIKKINQPFLTRLDLDSPLYEQLCLHPTPNTRVAKDAAGTVTLTLFEAFRYYFDITAIPTRYCLRVLAEFATLPIQRDKLLDIAGCSLESKELYYEFCKRERRSIAEVLWDFNSCANTIPLDYLLTIIPFIEPRQYSIASARHWYSSRVWWFSGGAAVIAQCPLLFGFAAPLVFHYLCVEQQRRSACRTKDGRAQRALPSLCSSAQRIVQRVLAYYNQVGFQNDVKPETQSDVQYLDLCVALVQHKTPLQREILGLCSQYLVTLPVGCNIPCRIVSGTRLGSSFQPAMKAPLMLVGAGTGITPIRALLQSRYLHWKHQTLKPSFQNTEEDRVGPILLVLGFRAPDADFLYSKDWAFFSTSHVVLPLSTQTESSTLWSGSPLLSNEKWSCTTLLGFSRSDASIKVYVQDAILHNATTVQHFLTPSHDAIVPQHEPLLMICGRSHPMPSQVIQYLIDILAKTCSGDVQRLMQDKQRRGFLIYDTWGV